MSMLSAKSTPPHSGASSSGFRLGKKSPISKAEKNLQSVLEAPGYTPDCSKRLANRKSYIAEDWSAKTCFAISDSDDEPTDTTNNNESPSSLEGLSPSWRERFGDTADFEVAESNDHHANFVYGNAAVLGVVNEVLKSHMSNKGKGKNKAAPSSTKPPLPRKNTAV